MRKLHRRSFLLFALFALFLTCAFPGLHAVPAAHAQQAAPHASAANARQALFYVGTYTNAGSKGIYAFRFDPATATVTPLGLAGEMPNPSFFAIHPNGRFLYAVSEVGTFEGQKTGSVSAFALNAQTGMLELLNRVSSRGSGPCHVSVDKSGKNVLVANYNSGSVAAFPVGEDGRLGEAASFIQHEGSGPNPSRQRGPHAHFINTSPDNRFAIVADLGLDQLLVYHFDAVKGTLAPPAFAIAAPALPALAPGAGPRHFVFGRNGKFVYCINELQSSITVFEYRPEKGTLREVQNLSTLPPDFKGQNSTAEIQIHPNGKFIYGSNRGHDSIAVFAVDQASGKLSPIERVSTEGKTPRNFVIDPSGKFLFAANQDSNNVVIFRVDPATGRLKPSGQKFEVSRPVCVDFVPAGSRGK